VNSGSDDDSGPDESIFDVDKKKKGGLKGSDGSSEILSGASKPRRDSGDALSNFS
jgi:hypothetical protein